MTPQLTANRFHRLEQITLKALRNLDRNQTVVLIPIGMIESHGEHLPLGTDFYSVESLALAVSARLLDQDSGLHILMLPVIPFGTDPIDMRRPDLFEDAGSVWIRRETLKSIVRDVTDHMVRYGFRNIFPIGYHGGAEQSMALDEVCTDLRRRYPGLVMFEPIGYVMAGAEQEAKPGLATLLGRPLTMQERVALKASVHASMFETSVMLHLRPELVDPSYKLLRSIEWDEVYRVEDWPGYVGTGPRHADPDVGAALLRWRGVRVAALIRRAMAGEDLSELIRHPRWRYEEGPDLPASAEDEDEAVSAHEPHIDSRPAIHISRETLDKVSSAAGSAKEEPEAASQDDDDIFSPTHTDDTLASGEVDASQVKPDDTPPASRMKTKPLAGEVEPDEDGPEAA
jgi:creatinine amidohydrolase